MARSCGLSRGAYTGLSPVDRARNGFKHHLLTNSGGVPLVVALTGGNRHDVTQLLPLVDAFPVVPNVCGRPRLHPGYLFADGGYDYDVYPRALRGVDRRTGSTCRSAQLPTPD